jgi:hypothetical protein
MLLKEKNKVFFQLAPNFFYFFLLAKILSSEASMQEQINKATGNARAIELEAEAKRKGLEKVSEALNKHGGLLIN